MTLGELIEFLAKADPTLIVPHGFYSPHSYRGYYAELAFEPKDNVTVGEMLEAARSAVGRTFQGYKGGDYKMSEYTPVWLAEWGDCGEGIGPTLLAYMLSEAAMIRRLAAAEQTLNDIADLADEVRDWRKEQE